MNRSLIFRNSDSLMSCLVSWIFAMALMWVWGHFGLLGTCCLRMVSAEVTWHLVAPMSLAKSSSQNVRSFHTVGFEFPADSSSPSDAKRMSRLGDMAATCEVDSVWCRAFCVFPTEDVFSHSVGLFTCSHSCLFGSSLLHLELQVIC